VSGARTRIAAVVMNDLRILRRDPAFVVIFTLMPLAFMAFTKGAFAAGLALEYPGRGFNGAEQVVPGSAVVFSGFLVGNLGFAIFREHSWATWDRLRASQLSTVELMAGKPVDVPLYWQYWRLNVQALARMTAAVQSQAHRALATR